VGAPVERDSQPGEQKVNFLDTWADTDNAPLRPTSFRVPGPAPSSPPRGDRRRAELLEEDPLYMCK